MAYSDFTIADLKQRFQLTINESDALFAHVADVALPVLNKDWSASRIEDMVAHRTNAMSSGQVPR
jgi:hypothetical protein